MVIAVFEALGEVMYSGLQPLLHTQSSALELGLGFIIGCVWGSFLGLVGTRLPSALLSEDDPSVQTLSLLLSPASHCTHCKHPLKAVHNIPLISYLYLRGLCAYCKAPISQSLFWIELLCALWCTYCAMRYGVGARWCVVSLYGTALIVLSFIDAQTQLLPDDLTLPLLWGGLLASSLHWSALSLSQSVWGAAAGYASLWLISRVYYAINKRVGLGDGDLKLVAAIGAWLGPQALIFTVLFASLGGVAFALYQIIQKRSHAEDYIAFGPFLAISALILQIFDH